MCIFFSYLFTYFLINFLLQVILMLPNLINCCFICLQLLSFVSFPHDKNIYMQEVGHFLAAFPKKVKLSIPYFIPNITLGSFGAITQVSIFNYFCMSVPDLKTLSGRIYFYFWGL